MDRIKIGIAGLAAALAVSGCYAETDLESYDEGDVGTVTFRNESRWVTYLGGCNEFEQQQLEEDVWISRGGDVMCFWEGVAQPVAPKSELELSFDARSPGTWRLHFETGLACEEGEPLSQENCGVMLGAYSNTFTVEERICELGEFAKCSPGDLCMRTRADCCGCEMGGESVAINAERADEWLSQIPCPPGTVCLAWYLCTDEIPMCVGGCCELVSP